MKCVANGWWLCEWMWATGLACVAENDQMIRGGRERWREKQNGNLSESPVVMISMNQLRILLEYSIARIIHMIHMVYTSWHKICYLFALAARHRPNSPWIVRSGSLFSRSIHRCSPAPSFGALKVNSMNADELIEFYARFDYELLLSKHSRNDSPSLSILDPIKLEWT